jgi:hypothetical protein
MAKKKALKTKAVKAAGMPNQKHPSPSRADQVKLRQLLKTKTRESLILAGTLLESAGAGVRDYAGIFTSSFIDDLIKPKRGHSQTETFQAWERLLAALSPLPAARLALTKALVGVVSTAGHMSLGGLSNISDIAADVLANHKDQLELNGLASISDKVTLSLSRHGGDSLHLSGLLSLSAAAADAVVNCPPMRYQFLS